MTQATQVWSHLKALVEILTPAFISRQFTGITFGCWYIWLWRWQIRNRMEVKSAFPLIWGRETNSIFSNRQSALKTNIMKDTEWNRTAEITSGFTSRSLEKSPKCYQCHWLLQMKLQCHLSLSVIKCTGLQIKPKTDPSDFS